MGRDHSIECDVCGESCGGLNADSEEHECDPASAEMLRLAREDWANDADLHAVKWNGHIVLVHRLAKLAANLAHAGQLCAAYNLGRTAEWNWANLSTEVQWVPGCKRTAPGFGGEG